MPRPDRRLVPLVLLALLTIGLVPSAVQAEEKEEVGEAASLAKALATGMDALKLRLDATMKRAALLEKAGKNDEALALYARVDTLYIEGVKELRSLITAARVLPIGPGIGPKITREPEAPVAAKPMPSTAQIDAAIAAGLDWMVRRQSKDGSWNPDRDVKLMHRAGVTAMGASAFLAAGYTHKGKDPRSKALAKALDHLLTWQDPEGLVGGRSSPQFMYSHAMATIAFVEAYGLTKDPRLHKAAQRALEFSAFSRNPYFAWRYGVKPGDNDTSITHWMLLGIAKARDLNKAAAAAGKAAPFTIDEDAFTGALAWVDKMTDTEVGRGGYITRGSGPARPRDLLNKFPSEQSESMTAAALHIRSMCGQSVMGSTLMHKGFALIDARLPSWNVTNGSIDMYYWLVGTLATERAGGEFWKRWRRALVPELVGNQRGRSHPKNVRGSWDPVGVWGAEGGRPYSTAAMLQCLAAAKRGAPTGG